MPRIKTKLSLPDRIAHATLKIAARGWAHVTPAALAKAAPCTMAEATGFLRQPCHTMRALANFITRKTLQDYTPDNQATPRDALFELLMLRFDVLQSYRAGVLAMIEASRHDPKLAVALAAAQPPQWQAMLQATQLRQTTPLHYAGLGVVYALALQAWHYDTSSDLTKTMAALDKQLNRVEQLCRLLKLDGNMG